MRASWINHKSVKLLGISPLCRHSRAGGPCCCDASAICQVRRTPESVVRREYITNRGTGQRQLRGVYQFTLLTHPTTCHKRHSGNPSPVPWVDHSPPRAGAMDCGPFRAGEAGGAPQPRADRLPPQARSPGLLKIARSRTSCSRSASRSRIYSSVTTSGLVRASTKRSNS